jgi:hypothetical protein
MRIGIDCRKIADFGIGTYIRGLLQALVELGGDAYVAFGGEHIAPMLPRGVEHVIVDPPHYSIRELLILGRAADRARLDLFHAPHYWCRCSERRSSSPSTTSFICIIGIRWRASTPEQ